VAGDQLVGAASPFPSDTLFAAEAFPPLFTSTLGLTPHGGRQGCRGTARAQEGDPTGRDNGRRWTAGAAPAAQGCWLFTRGIVGGVCVNRCHPPSR